LLSHNSRSLAQKSRIESRIASRGNHTPAGCQASENIALTRDDGLTMLRRVSVTPAHNIVRQCDASCGKFFLVLLEALEHVVCEHWYPGALLFEFFTASSCGCSVLRLSNIDLGDGRHQTIRNLFQPRESAELSRLRCATDQVLVLAF
jgi:hypothetical protein